METSQAEVDAWKEAAAESAASQLTDGMIVGLGSGTTAKLAVDAIGKRVNEGLRIIGVSTSEKTSDQARRLGIQLATLAEYPKLDLTIDGADEVELETLTLIKGGGGNLLREKIVASASSTLIIIVDQRKLVPKLGTHPLPVEVVPFGWQSTEARLRHLNAAPVLRTNGDKSPYVTDGGHYILDCSFGPIDSAQELGKKLDETVGVVEHGLFIGMTSEVRIGSLEGVQILKAAAKGKHLQASL